MQFYLKYEKVFIALWPDNILPTYWKQLLILYQGKRAKLWGNRGFLIKQFTSDFWLWWTILKTIQMPLKITNKIRKYCLSVCLSIHISSVYISLCHQYIHTFVCLSLSHSALSCLSSLSVHPSIWRHSPIRTWRPRSQRTRIIG